MAALIVFLAIVFMICVALALSIFEYLVSRDASRAVEPCEDADSDVRFLREVGIRAD